MGTSAAAGERRSLVTASALSRPDRTCCIAEGSVVGGVLLARKIHIKKNGIRIEALADGATTGNSFTILGITVITNGGTEFKDVLLATIGSGTGLRVQGFKSGAAQITATKVEARSVDANDVILRGPLDANAAEPGFNILGVPVTVLPGAEFEDASRSNFFTNATANTIVKAKGSEIPNDAILAREVELED